MTEQELIKLKENIEKSKATISELKGELSALTKQLNDEYNYGSFNQGSQELQKLENSNKVIEKEIDKKTNELKNKY